MTILSHETIRQAGDYVEVSLDNIERDLATSLFRQMLRLRRVEEALHAEYHPGNEMRCPVHFCIGQESIPAALSQCIQSEDYVFSHHRSHGYYFAKGSPLRELFAELYGRETGANGGMAGSQDISHLQTKFFSGAILAGSIAIGTGVALGIQMRGSSQVVACGFGEGATDEGAYWEALDFAAKERLPILFLIENNRYATLSDQMRRHVSDNICERAESFGVSSTKIFGNDCPLAYRSIRTAINKIRLGGGPALIEAYTYRTCGHVGPEDDSIFNYRPIEEIDFWKAHCPIVLMEREIIRQNIATFEDIKVWEGEITQEIAGYFDYAKQSQFPQMVDWHYANVNIETPLADKLLRSAEPRSYDGHQAETKLGPY